jgi:hypothetical protein
MALVFDLVNSALIGLVVIVVGNALDTLTVRL